MFLACRYYVRPCAKPKERTAVAVAVRVGSLVEEDDEQVCCLDRVRCTAGGTRQQCAGMLPR
jgi:hypothetical protein